MSETRAVRRIKVRRTHARKLFFEKVLVDWRESSEDRNFRSILFRAYLNLKNYPLEVTSPEDLKSIKGIGEFVATKLDAAWDSICSNYLSIPTLKQIKELRKGDCVQFVNSPTTGGLSAGPSHTTSSSTAAITSIANNAPSSSLDCHEKVRRIGARKRAPKIANKDINVCEIGERAISKVSTHDVVRKRPPQRCIPRCSIMDAASAGFLIIAPFGLFPCAAYSSLNAYSPKGLTASSTEQLIAFSKNPLLSVREASVKQDLHFDTVEEMAPEGNTDELLSYNPTDFLSSQVVLLVDNRENHGGRKGRSICDHLQKKQLNFELRALAIGDYVWIIRMKDGREMMLDYIVERKTCNDLVHSIRSSRYKEQKRRLSNSGLRNVVYLVEGNGTREKGIDQALTSTSIIDGFMVKITHSMEETAQFLHAITQRLIQKVRTDSVKAMSFESFQRYSKKTQRRSVKEVFMRMLTVCPRMTVEKASLVVAQYPSLSALTRLYESTPLEQRPLLLAEAVPGIPKALSKQLAFFFDGV
uniref:Crossover junction endonuclease MUS81 n=1 Tax=Ascaris suum TaxID=6253 RepID=F1L3B7_ASCSU